jgi:signal transduction histidine kinase
MRLSQFIRTNLEEILSQWEAFAKTRLPGADAMSSKELRDHAQQILEVIAVDLATSQTDAGRDAKSKGLAPAKEGGEAKTAATKHGGLRVASGFTLVQLISEFRALRASVLDLWLKEENGFGAEATGDLMRFNEAMDQALTESVVEFDAHTARSRDTFLAVLGHDLRSPLASMALAGDFLVGPEARSGNIALVGDRVKRGAATMSAMVNDLLEYARTQLGGKMPFTPQASDLRSVALASLRDSSASHPDCPFELEVQGDLQGEFDALRVQQLVTNLLTNAAQYRDKHYRVTLSLLGEPDHLVVRVKNRGPVIPMSATEAIFDPMVRLARDDDGETDRPNTSMGLGLFIAREITEAHAGTIGVVSTVKEGTTFTVTLPRKAASGDPTGTAAANVDREPRDSTD